MKKEFDIWEIIILPDFYHQMICCKIFDFLRYLVNIYFSIWFGAAKAIIMHFRFKICLVFGGILAFKWLFCTKSDLCLNFEVTYLQIPMIKLGFSINHNHFNFCVLVEIHNDHLVAAKEVLNNRMEYQLLPRIMKYSKCHPFHATQIVNPFS